MLSLLAAMCVDTRSDHHFLWRTSGGRASMCDLIPAGQDSSEFASVSLSSAGKISIELSTVSSIIFLASSLI